MVDKIERLQSILNEYTPHMKVWSDAEVGIDEEGITGRIKFTNPKGKNEYAYLIKVFPLSDIDRLIKIYSSKLTNIKEKK